MWRALVYIALLAIAAFAAAWLAERPGTVLVTFGGYQLETTVAVAAVALAGLALLLALLWTAVSFLMGLPERMRVASRTRKRARGYDAVSRGMVAVGAGDAAAARRHAGEAERLLGEEPLTLLLKAQAAQVSGNRAGAEAAFARMMDNRDTRVLGLRGLFVEARRRGDATAAQAYASEAARLAPAVTWANEAVLEAKSAEGDWRGALNIVERRASLGLIDRDTAKRQRAVLLTADALAHAERDRDGALASALEAVKLAPDLVPAAALAGRLLSQKGELKRAAKVIETAWKLQPHPELADVYLNLRPGDSARDRLGRAETLARLSSWAPEARLAVARAAMEAREFARARSALEPLLTERPTMRSYLLMADLEQAEHGETGRVRELVARAARAPRDPAWIADGMVSDRWAPISPVTGRLDAFVWQAPPDVLVAPERAVLEDVAAEADEKPIAIAAAPIIVEAAPGEAPVQPAGERAGPAVEIIEAEQPAAAEPDRPPAEPAEPTGPSVAGPVGAATPEPAPPEAPVASPAVADDAAPAKDPDARPPNGPAVQTAEVRPVVFAVDHAPDDPGPEEEGPRKSSRFRLFH